MIAARVENRSSRLEKRPILPAVLKRPFLLLLLVWLLALLLPKAALASFTNHFAAWPSATAQMATSPLPENGWPEASISLVLSELRMESRNGLFCNDDPVGNFDAIGEDPNPLSDWERKMVGQDEQSAEAIIHRFDSGARLTTPADILGNQLHTSSFGGNLGWMPFTQKWDLLSQYPNVAEPDVALLESTRENTVYAQYLLAQHGLLPKRQLQRLELRTYTGLLDLTTIAATIPFQVPSAASLPWIGSNLSTRIADTNALYAPINPMGTMKGPVVFTPPEGATDAEIAEMQAFVQGANYAWRVGALSDTGRVTTVGVLRAASSEAAAAERSAASGLGIPYRGVVGHLPDTTWTGDPEAFLWLDQTARINSSLGAQARGYPLGFKPTGFTVEGDQ